METIVLKTKPIPINQKYFVVNGRNILSTKYRDAKVSIALETRTQWKNEPLSEDVTLNIMQYFGDNRKRDIDAYLKILLDSMEGVVFENDCQVTEMHVYKQVDKDNPRVVIQIL